MAQSWNFFVYEIPRAIDDTSKLLLTRAMPSFATLRHAAMTHAALPETEDCRRPQYFSQ